MLGRVLRALLGADRALRVRAQFQKNDLDVLARFYGTDKSSRHHNYTPIYQSHLAPIRRSARSVLEIGVGGETSASNYASPAGGQSLRMWADYFPHAQIVGIDIYEKDVVGPRIAFERGDQSDPDFLRDLIRRYGPFDLVVDDGSHIGRHIIASHSVLWNAVKPMGFYVIEDLDVAYDEGWEGGPPGKSGTAVALLKALLDDTLQRYKQSFTPSILSLHIYGEIAVMQKAPASVSTSS